MHNQDDPETPPILSVYLLEVLRFLLRDSEGDTVPLADLRAKLADQLRKSGFTTKFLEAGIAYAQEQGWIEMLHGHGGSEMVKFTALGWARLHGPLAAPSGECASPPRNSVDEMPSGTEIHQPKENIFRKKGSRWEIVYLGQKIETDVDRVGFQYIAELLRRPQKEVRVEDLSAVAHGKPVAESSEYSAMNSEELHNKGMHAHKSPDAPTRRKGKDDFEGAIQEMKNELADARNTGATARAEESEQYLDKLRKDQKSPKSSRASEDGARGQNVRNAVRKAIWDAVNDFKTNAPHLYQHFHAAISTGYMCDYSPTPDTTWLVH